MKKRYNLSSYIFFSYRNGGIAILKLINGTQPDFMLYDNNFNRFASIMVCDLNFDNNYRIMLYLYEDNKAFVENNIEKLIDIIKEKFCNDFILSEYIIDCINSELILNEL